MTFRLKSTTEKQCNDCIHYRSKFPGYCKRVDPRRPDLCFEERAYIIWRTEKCTHLGVFFKAMPQKTLGYYQPDLA